MVNNSIIEVDIHDNLTAEIRDYGRGIPLGALVDAVSKLNTGGKYDTAVFTASVGMNGVGLKAVNALSSRFIARSVRDGQMREAIFEKGVLVSDEQGKCEEENGTYIYFEPDNSLFQNYRFHSEFVENMLRNYTYLNTGLAIFYNGRRILSRNGLEDLLKKNFWLMYRKNTGVKRLKSVVCCHFTLMTVFLIPPPLVKSVSGPGKSCPGKH